MRIPASPQPNAAISTPERFAIDDDERRAENASGDRVRDGAPQALLYLGALDACAQLNAVKS
jgi:hypothetical protein